MFGKFSKNQVWRLMWPQGSAWATLTTFLISMWRPECPRWARVPPRGACATTIVCRCHQKSIQINENHRKSMKINEKQWKSMKIDENQWESIKFCWFSLSVDDGQGVRPSSICVRVSDTLCPTLDTLCPRDIWCSYTDRSHSERPRDRARWS